MTTTLPANLAAHIARTLASAADDLSPRVVPAGMGVYNDLGDRRGYAVLTAEETGGAFLLLDSEVDPDGGIPPHIHSREDETFYILSGRLEIRVGDRTYDAGPGDTVFGPRGVVHAWRNCTTEKARLLTIITPGANFQAFYFAMVRYRIVQGTKEEFRQLLADYGMEMLPPGA
jgi:mannose-6-phosphate isomerase-like protein (cupin superfamily)